MMTYKEFMALPRGGWLEADASEDVIVLRDIKTGEAVVEIAAELNSGEAAQAARRPSASAGHPNNGEQAEE